MMTIMITFALIAETLIFTSAISIDALVSSFAYGTKKIRIPLGPAMLINIICSAFLAASLLLGTIVGSYIPPLITTLTAAVIMFVLGLLKLFGRNKTKIDCEKKVLPAKEASVLAVALSLDGLALGFGAGISSADWQRFCIIIAFSLITGLIFVMLGAAAGNKFASKSKLNLSWLSGILLIGLGVWKLL